MTASPVLDDQTKRELQPQCGLHLASRERCPAPAEWIIYSTCRDCGDKFIDLLRVAHSVSLPDAAVGCADCRTYQVYVTSVEAL